MKHSRIIAAAFAAVALAGVAAQPALAAPSGGAGNGNGNGRPVTYTLNGDPEGSRFEGIGADTRSGAFYVSEVTGGEIHRGQVRTAQTEQWLAGDGADGRWTARGITVDAAGNVYIAGGPNGIDHPGAPDLWVYSREGSLLAALRAPAPNAFLNDVAIGPDGAAYFTNSNAPQVFRVALEGGQWTATTWADATGTIATQSGFNLGGIVVSTDKSALVVAQGNTGDLWRFGFDGSVSAVDTGDADLVNADGLVLQGTRLTVVQNFSHAISTLRLSADGSKATLLERATSDPSRVFTTAKVLDGRILYVDSEFGAGQMEAPYEVVTTPFAG